MKNTQIRNAGLAGIAFGVVVAASAFLPGTPPELDAPLTEIQSFLLDKRDQFAAANVLALVAIPLFVLFASGLRELVRSGGSERDNNLSAVIAISGAVGIAIASVASLICQAVFYSPTLRDSASPELFSLVWNASLLIFFVALGAVATFVASASIGLRGKAVVPSWFNSVGIVVALIILVAGCMGIANIDFGPVAFFSSVLFMLWSLVTGIFMVRNTGGVKAS